MNALKSILVAVDFSTGAHSALEQAARLAKLNASTLHILHVVDTAAVSALATSRRESFERQAIIATDGAKQALESWLLQSGVPAGYKTAVIAGVPLHEILEHAKALKPDLIVAGITGSGNSTTGAGSLARKLARRAQSKVLLVRGPITTLPSASAGSREASSKVPRVKSDHSDAFRKIVACIDFSDTAREVAEISHRLAILDGTKVDFLHVWQEPWLLIPYAYLKAEAAAYREKHEQQLRANLKTFVSDASKGIDAYEVMVHATNHADGITAYSISTGADLIVIGGKGSTNLRYELLGSTAEHLLTMLPCSVLVVKLPPD